MQNNKLRNVAIIAHVDHGTPSDEGTGLPGSDPGL